MRNLLTHYGQVSLDNTRAHAVTYVNKPTRDAQDNDMFYYFLADSLTNEIRTTVLLYSDTYTVTNIPVASALLKQIIILTWADNPASTMHIREMLIESMQKLLQLKGNITEFNQWVRKQIGCLHPREQEAVDLLYYLWKAYKAAPDEEFFVYIKDLKSQADSDRATYTAEDLMVRAEKQVEEDDPDLLVAIRHATRKRCGQRNTKKGEDSSPLEKFSGVKVAPKLRFFHAFGCPTYVLDNAIQSGQGAPKWKQRLRLGVYLGPSPNHARTVALVLNPRTGHMSPQFHVKFDDFFETVQMKDTDLDSPEPQLKYLSRFAIRKGQPKTRTTGPLGYLLAP